MCPDRKRVLRHCALECPVTGRTRRSTSTIVVDCPFVSIPATSQFICLFTWVNEYSLALRVSCLLHVSLSPE